MGSPKIEYNVTNVWGKINDQTRLSAEWIPRSEEISTSDALKSRKELLAVGEIETDVGTACFGGVRVDMTGGTGKGTPNEDVACGQSLGGTVGAGGDNTMTGVSGTEWAGAESIEL